MNSLAAERTPKEVGGTHYQEGIKVSPWSLQQVMQTSGSAFVDSRRSDAIKYVFRMKGDLRIAEDMQKAKHCIEAGLIELHNLIAEEEKA